MINETLTSIKTIVSVFSISFTITFLLTPYITKLATQLGAVDHPSTRKIHKHPIPLLGGISLYAGILSTSLLFLTITPVLKGIFMGSLLLLLLGILDDIIPIPAWLKLMCQICIALIPIQNGLLMESIWSPLGAIEFGKWSTPITILWIVGITNTMNLIDGSDGIAAGISAIAGTILSITAIQTGQVYAAYITTSIAGASFAFLRYNFAPAQIFMGDSGSMTLGYLLSTVSIFGVLKSTIALSFLIPVLVLGIPIVDLIFSIGRRLIAGKNIFQADTKHVHHWLLRKGLSKSQVAAVIYLTSIILGIIAILIAK